MSGWENLRVFLETFNEILTAGIAITAFSLLLYAMAFNLRDRVARSFAIILICTTTIFSAEAIGSIISEPTALSFWMSVQWLGIVFLPAVYLHFSDALLATTGRPSRGRRRWAVRLVYLGAAIFAIGLPFDWLVGPVITGNPPAPYFQTTWFTDLFIFFYLSVMVISWANFVRAYRRTTTNTTRRRMAYLIAGALAPALGAFPFLPYGPGFAARHQLIFWSLSILSNIMVGILLVGMAYSVAFFGVSWPDRVVKTRLYRWIMRGPFTASITLAVTTLTRRAGEAFSSSAYTAMVPIVMVGSILLCEYLITLFSASAERRLFYRKDTSEMDLLHSLENQLMTGSDLEQFVEMLLATVLDRLQSKGAYLVALSPEGMELIVSSGRTRFNDVDETASVEDDLLQQVVNGRLHTDLFRWGDDYLFPLMNGTPEQPELIGLLGVSGAPKDALDDEQLQAMEILTERAGMALRGRRLQQKLFKSLESYSDEVNLIQRLRAAGQFDRASLLADEQTLPQGGDFSDWVKDALSHYWGGPKLTQNPLLRLKVVQDALKKHDGNNANALRAILREAIDRIRPEGERRFTGEWILYNILEMKFVEGRKVREVALRLAMSEADLYRKQRIAVETVAKTIEDMEQQARKEVEYL